MTVGRRSMNHRNAKDRGGWTVKNIERVGQIKVQADNIPPRPKTVGNKLSNRRQYKISSNCLSNKHFNCYNQGCPCSCHRGTEDK